MPKWASQCQESLDFSGLWASDFLDFSSSQDFASGWQDGNGQQHLTASNGQLPTVDRPYGIFPLQIVAGFDAERWLKDVEGVETFETFKDF